MDSLKLMGVLVLCIVAAFIPVSAQQAIHTSNADGSCVNCNLYPTAEDVYLTGGPPGCGGSPFPDGQYYFQVTNPSGSVLLSTDPLASRVLTVSGGVITGATHPTTPGHCGPPSVQVQLAPFDPSDNGVYKVWLTLVSAYNAGCEGTGCFVPADSKTDNFKVAPGGGGTVFSLISGTKFYDSNTNGVQDGIEPGILGWRIQKSAPDPAIEYTDSTGAYSFLVPDTPQTYTITEVLPFSPMGTWINTTPLSGVATIPGSPTVDFGNVCLGAGGGHTKGFWTNKNGQDLIGSTELAALVALNLRNANGSAFDPPNKAALKNWLKDANAVNMAYMLSAQLAAMRLNVLEGFVVGDAWVHSGVDPDGCPDIANPAGFVQISPLMTAANVSLGTYDLTLSGHAQRSCQEFLKDALDDANNNQNFVQPGPGSCTFTTPY